MAMDMDKMVMARHHAEMCMYDSQLAQIFSQASQVYNAKAQSNYQMYLHHMGQNHEEQMPGMSAQPIMGGMPLPSMLPQMTQQPMTQGMYMDDMMPACPMMMEHMMKGY